MTHETSTGRPKNPRPAALVRDRELVNFRDFGDLPSRYGGLVAADRLYRSGHFARASAPTIARLEGMSFTVIADLRLTSERMEQPGAWPDHAAAQIFCLRGDVGDDAPHLALLKARQFDFDSIDRFYADFYRNIPFDPLYKPLFGAVLRAVASTAGRALIYCSVGKDRTGMLVALIQHALGVPPELIVADYMKSREADGIDAIVPEIQQRLRKRLAQEVEPELAKKMLGVEEDYLRGAIDEIERRCRSMDRYLEDLGLTQILREQMRERLIVR
ncbi:MAG: protein tyrosine phosphatase [Gammaproteobacteria bacterium]|nr:protein tyrosine phosphatase [Gammaproteobacteria bacterium]